MSGTNLAAVVPAQAARLRPSGFDGLRRPWPAEALAKAGTHNHQSFGYHWPCHIELPRRMGPRLRGDDSGVSLLHIFAGRFRGDDRHLP